MASKKIINDPVYGLISINNGLVFELIQHPYFQRLRNINQLGLTHLVYPGATHSRLQHSIGAMYLMQNALDTLSEKDILITEAEKEATLAAILLHDIGHTAFSHALEFFFTPTCSHEDFSQIIINELNKQFKGRLDIAIDIIANKYPKKFLHQLVSSQLDVDRLDYLNRDSFFTGVSEGVIGSDRIIKMLNVKDLQLVAEEKAVYSIEKFIISRRLMYWQVYLHKTVHVAETMLISALKRAKELYLQGKDLFVLPCLRFFFDKERTVDDFLLNTDYLKQFIEIDDTVIWFCVKMWQDSSDRILATLSRDLYQRNLFKIEVSDQAFDLQKIDTKKKEIMERLSINEQEVAYFVVNGEMFNRAYNAKIEAIKIMDKQGNIHQLEDLSDHLNHRTLSESVCKFFMCYPKLFT